MCVFGPSYLREFSAAIYFSARNSYVMPPLCSNGNLANIQTYNGQSVDEQNYSVREQVTTPRPNNTGVMLKVRTPNDKNTKEHQSPENSFISDAMTIQFILQREFTNTFTHSPNACENKSSQLLKHAHMSRNQSGAEKDNGLLFREQWTLLFSKSKMAATNFSQSGGELRVQDGGSGSDTLFAQE